MTRYTVKTATAKFSQYGEVEFSKNTTQTATRTNNKRIGWYQVKYTDEFGTLSLSYPTLSEVVEQLSWHITEGRLNTAIAMGQSMSTELTCEYVPPTSDTEEEEERGSGRVDEKLNSDSQAHHAVNNVVSLSMWKNSSKSVSEVGSKSAKALQKRLAKLGIKPSNQPVAA